MYLEIGVTMYNDDAAPREPPSVEQSIVFFHSRGFNVRNTHRGSIFGFPLSQLSLRTVDPYYPRVCTTNLVRNDVSARYRVARQVNATRKYTVRRVSVISPVRGWYERVDALGPGTSGKKNARK